MAAKKTAKAKSSRMVYPKSFNDKKYPEFIRNSVFLKAYPKPEKVFPRIGLKNCEVALSSIKTDEARELMDSFRGGKNLKVCFSSSGEKGYWDIATMSMRKITSCMYWGSGNSRTLIGSILDPYTGIIYITDGKNTKYGEGMLARAVVRFVINKKNLPHIFIEEIYYSQPYHRRMSAELRDVFEVFIAAKTNLPIAICPSSFSIPQTETTHSIFDAITDDADSTLSYRDSCIYYTVSKKFYDPSKVKSYARH